MFGLKRFASAGRFGQAHDEVNNCLRFHLVGHRLAPLAWQRRLPHHQFTLLQELLQAA